MTQKSKMVRKASNKAEAIAETFLGVTVGAYIQMRWTDDEIIALCQTLIDGVRRGVQDPELMKAADDLILRSSK